MSKFLFTLVLAFVLETLSHDKKLDKIYIKKIYNEGIWFFFLHFFHMEKQSLKQPYC